MDGICSSSSTGGSGGPAQMYAGLTQSECLVDPVLPVGRPVTVALVDAHRFSQGCIASALRAAPFGIQVLSFDTVDSVFGGQGEVDVVLFSAHQRFDERTIQSLGRFSAFHRDISIIVLLHADETLDADTFRAAMSIGIQGLVPTRTTTPELAVAAIPFVRAGGLFAPRELLLCDRPEQVPSPRPFEFALQDSFTSRQAAVLDFMARGKANKIIAHELNMSESTVKVHVRNIMRKVGATNRTEAVYNAQRYLAAQSTLSGLISDAAA